MANKRAPDMPVFGEPVAKRDLLGKLVVDLALDENDGPQVFGRMSKKEAVQYPSFSSLSQAQDDDVPNFKYAGPSGEEPYLPSAQPIPGHFLESAYEEAYKEHADWMLKKHTDVMSLVVEPPKSMDVFPREIHRSEFPLTKSGVKSICLGIDVANWEPFVLFLWTQSKGGNRVWVRISWEEMDVLMNDVVVERILQGLSRNEDSPAINVGGLRISIAHQKNNITTMCLERPGATGTKIYLAKSSWQMFSNLRRGLKVALAGAQRTANDLKLHFPKLLEECMEKMPLENNVTHCDVFRAAFESSDVPLSPLAIEEIICYHSDFVEESLLRMK